MVFCNGHYLVAGSINATRPPWRELPRRSCRPAPGSLRQPVVPRRRRLVPARSARSASWRCISTSQRQTKKPGFGRHTSTRASTKSTATLTRHSAMRHVRKFRNALIDITLHSFGHLLQTATRAKHAFAPLLAAEGFSAERKRLSVIWRIELARLSKFWKR